MTSIDEIFRKRKLDDPTATASFSRSPNKSAKLANGSSPSSSLLRHEYSGKGNGTSSRNTVPPPPPEDNAAEDDNLDDVEAGPSLPPGGGDDDDDDDDAEGDDAEGRFFESGISAQERSALNLLGQAEAEGDGGGGDDDDEHINLAWLKKTALSLERKINRNAELRAKFEGEPLKFIGSEADLDAEIRRLSLLAAAGNAGDLYGDFVRSGCAASLVGLLAHENSDIAVTACQVLAELTDDDNTGVDDGQWKLLADALLANDLVDLLVANLTRLDGGGGGGDNDSDSDRDNDRDGVYHVLSTLENLLSEPANHGPVGGNVALLQWLVKRIHRPDTAVVVAGQVGQNRLYAAEILAILSLHQPAGNDSSSSSSGSRHNLAQHTEAVDTILQLLAPYRHGHAGHDNTEEAEFVQNLFDTLACLVQDALGARQFIDGEGVELCLLMLRKGKGKGKGKSGGGSGSSIQSRALQVLDHAMTGASTAVDMCTYFVDTAAGLGPLFGLFMHKTSSSSSGGGGRERDAAALEHLLAVLAALLRYTPAASPARIRTLAKFVEHDHAKIGRLLDLRRHYDGQYQRHLVKGDGDGDDDSLASSLVILNTVDLVLSWLAAEDDAARVTISRALESTGAGSAASGLSVLRKSLQDQLDALSEPDDADPAHADTRDVLRALLDCLA